MAIITRDYALRLIRAGRAGFAGGIARDSLTTANAEGDAYVVINRYDVWRTDHYRAIAADTYRREIVGE